MKSNWFTEHLQTSRLIKTRFELTFNAEDNDDNPDSLILILPEWRLDENEKMSENTQTQPFESWIDF